MSHRGRKREGNIPIEQPSLMIDGAPHDGPSPEKPGLFRLLTNRNNLLNILSSGWILPAACYDNYYEDPGQHARDGVVLLRDDPSEELCSQMVGDDPAIFPVVLYVDLSGLGGDVAAVGPDYQARLLRLGEENAAAEAIALVSRGTIPSSRIVSVHFQSASDLKEHQLREYENVPAGEIPMLVSPDVFRGPKLEFIRLRQALNDANALIGPANELLVERAGSLGGALTMLATAMRTERELPLSLVAAPLSEIEHLNGARRTPARRSSAAHEDILHRCAAYLPPALIGKHGRTGTAQSRIHRLAKMAANAPGASESNNFAHILLFVTACEVLAETAPRDFFNGDALHRIRDIFNVTAPTSMVSSGDVDQVYARCIALLDDINAILESDMDVADFPADAGPVGDGLLRFLQRSSPASVMSWASEMPPPSADTIAVAALLSGVLHRRERIPVDLRPDQPFVQRLDERIAWQINRVANGLSPLEDTPGVVVESATEGERHANVLKLNGEIIMSQPIDPSRAATRPTDQKGTGEIRREREEHISGPGSLTNGGQGDLADKVKKLFLSDALRQPRVREAGIRLCRIASWDDCLTTVFLLNQPDIFMRSNPEDRSVELRIPGIVKPPGLELREREFRTRVESTSASAVPVQAWAEVAELLGIHRVSEPKRERGSIQSVDDSAAGSGVGDT